MPLAVAHIKNWQKFKILVFIFSKLFFYIYFPRSISLTQPPPMLKIFIHFSFAKSNLVKLNQKQLLIQLTVPNDVGSLYFVCNYIKLWNMHQVIYQKLSDEIAVSARISIACTAGECRAGCAYIFSGLHRAEEFIQLYFHTSHQWFHGVTVST